MNQTLDSVVEGTLNEFRGLGYSPRTVKSHACTFSVIVKMHSAKGINALNPDIIDEFICNVTTKYQNGSMQRIRYMHLVKCADYLCQYNETGEITTGTRKTNHDLSSYYEEVITGISLYDDWNDKTKHSIRQFALPYVKWLMANDYRSFDYVDESVIRSYLIDCASRMSLNSMDTAKRALKKFHKYLYANGIISIDYEKTFSFVSPTEHKVKLPADLDEVSMVLSSIDRSTSIGKRDYAVILLAVVTGLRSVDIIGLTFDEIDWVSGEIIISQSKTGNQVALPLTKDVGLALQDYILNARHHSDERYVFLREHSPHTKMGRSIPYMIYNTYRQRLGLRKQPFHGLRRALGTNMVIAGIPVTTVAQVLGHSSIEPTSQYISLDSANLKQCALSLDAIPAKKGGARR